MSDRHLPGDETFVPTPPRVIVEVKTPNGVALAQAMTISPVEQANQQHNRLRYAELQKLRSGLPNLYNETRYRN